MRAVYFNSFHEAFDSFLAKAENVTTASKLKFEFKLMNGGRKNTQQGQF